MTQLLLPRPSRARIPLPGVFAVILFLGGVVSACTIQPKPVDTSETLVTKEAPIFDKRFEKVSAEELSLKNFWTPGKSLDARSPIPIQSNTFAEITGMVKDAVVNIYTLRLEERDAQFGISPNDILPIKIPLVSNIFEFVPFKVPIPYRTQGISLGSGFIINEEGYILTNAHVIHNAVDIRVVFSEGQYEYPAKIIGVDRLTDTALIKIEPEAPPNVLPLGDSDLLRPGEMVLAIGNPLGLRHTVTSGLISAKERISPHKKDQHVNFLQTDSAINPGSSGGPLINLYGEVVGINTAIVSDAQLIGFAVPINTVKEVMPLLVLGKTDRGWFGAKATPMTIQDAVELSYTGEGGLLVMEVEEGSPADKSGVKPRDIIVKFNGEPVRNFVIFRRKLLGLMPGEKIHLTLFRKGNTYDIVSTLVKKEAGENAE